MKWIGLAVIGLLVIEATTFLLVARLLRSTVFALWLLGLAMFLGLSLISRAKRRLDPNAILSARARGPESGLTGLFAPLVSGVLLAFPGFLTDVLALLIFLPSARAWLARPLLKLSKYFLQRALARGMVPPPVQRPGARRVLDAEFKVLD